MAHDLDSVRAAIVISRSRLVPETKVVATGVGYMFTRERKTDRDRGRIDFPIVPIVHFQRNRKETP